MKLPKAASPPVNTDTTGLIHAVPRLEQIFFLFVSRAT